MKKRTVLTTLILTATIATTTLAGGTYSYYKKLVKREGIAKVREYYSEDLSLDILENRGDDIIIEKIVGEVIDSQKNGRILNPNREGYDYISYKRVKRARKGDIILTVCIYEPGNSAIDDVCQRFDFILDQK